MGLLGKFFKGGDRDDGGSGRSKRGRAPSIRRAADGSPAGAGAPLPEINIDDIEKARQAAPTAGKPAAPAPDVGPRAARPADKPPIEVDLPAGKPAAAPRSGPSGRGEAAAAAPAPRAEKPAGGLGAAAGGDASKRSTRLQSRQKPIGELLIQAGTVSTEQLSRALKIQDKGGKGLVGQILVNMGACQQAAILASLNRQFRISTVELERVEISPSVAALVPTDKCREHRLMPFEKIGSTLCISMANCLNRKAINEVEELTKLKVKPFNSTWIEIRKAIEAAEKAGPVAAAAPAGAEPVVESEAQAAQPAAGEESISIAGMDAEPAVAESVAEAPQAVEAPAAPAPAPTPAPAPAPAAKAAEEAEPPPFVGPAKARIEGLDTLDSSEAEVVQLTERGLASKHLDEIRRRRAERQAIMGTGKGVVGRLVAPDLDSYRPEGDEAGKQPDVEPLAPLRVVDEQMLTGADLPTATQLAANVEEFRSPATAPEPAAAAGSPEPAAPEAAAEPEAAPAPAAVEPAAAELPSVPAISFQPDKSGAVDPLPISDEDWATLEADLEPDPVVAWQATYASAGPVPAAQSWL